MMIPSVSSSLRKTFRQINEVGAAEWVTADTNNEGLTEAAALHQRTGDPHRLHSSTARARFTGIIPVAGAVVAVIPARRAGKWTHRIAARSPQSHRGGCSIPIRGHRPLLVCWRPTSAKLSSSAVDALTSESLRAERHSVFRLPVPHGGRGRGCSRPFRRRARTPPGRRGKAKPRSYLRGPSAAATGPSADAAAGTGSAATEDVVSPRPEGRRNPEGRDEEPGEADPRQHQEGGPADRREIRQELQHFHAPSSGSSAARQAAPAPPSQPKERWRPQQ